VPPATFCSEVTVYLIRDVIPRMPSKNKRHRGCVNIPEGVDYMFSITSLVSFLFVQQKQLKTKNAGTNL